MLPVRLVGGRPNRIQICCQGQPRCVVIACVNLDRRLLYTSPVCSKKSRLEVFRSKFLKEEDLNKRPSDLEIARKDLPPNQPTLAERAARDRVHQYHQYDRHRGYWENKPLSIIQQMEIELKKNPKQLAANSFNVVKEEVGKFQEEAKSGAYDVHKNMRESIVRPGERRKEWGFQSELELDQWILTKDSDWGEGYSSAELGMNSAGTALMLKGNLSTRVPADGRTNEAGYVNITSVNRRMSFGRLKLLHHWENYTHLTMNIRGDGRKYLINLKIKRDYDVTWDDRWHYPLFTRGGPHWQYVKIPFSKFYFGHGGAIQDRQSKVHLNLMQSMSITLKDRISGPFQLEIKDISLHNDPWKDDEEFAYEKYRVPDFWIL